VRPGLQLGRPPTSIVSDRTLAPSYVVGQTTNKSFSATAVVYLSIVSVLDVARFKYKLMGIMVYF
jgi:hypothetical protein